MTQPAHVGQWANATWLDRGWWPSNWVHVAEELAGAIDAPRVGVFRCTFMLNAPTVLRIHVTADERYRLFLDGQPIGSGLERGCEGRWSYETYELSLSAGEHRLVAKVWHLASAAPWAQVGIRHGFLCSADDPAHRPLVATGAAEWEGRWLPGYQFGLLPLTTSIASSGLVGFGRDTQLDGQAIDWAAEAGDGDGWLPVRIGHRGWDGTPSRINERMHALTPAMLSEQLDEPWWSATVRRVVLATADVQQPPINAARDLPDERMAWQRLLSGDATDLVIPPHTQRQVIIDLGDYVCCHTQLTLVGGRNATARIAWAEAMYDDAAGVTKRHRDAVDGQHFVSHLASDTFRAAGDDVPRTFAPLWWKCGRYIEVVVRTSEAPLRISGLALRETRYPLEWRGSFACDDARVAPIVAPMIRSLQTNLHETYMDCPYYEQMMWIGDARLQMLCGYVGTRDDRPQRKAIAMFDASRELSGFTRSKSPTRSVNVLPAFSLVYVGIVHDFALWRGDLPFVRTLMHGVRGVLDAFLLHRRVSDGLVRNPPGWEFIDWAKGWGWGNPPARDGVSGVMNWALVVALTEAARLETWLDEPELASRWSRLARELATQLRQSLHVPDRDLYADSEDRTSFSQHAQALAVLSGLNGAKANDAIRRSLISDVAATGLTPTSMYFAHYLFDAYHHLGDGAQLLDCLHPWTAAVAAGLKTVPETAEPTRSDNHAWSSHPLFHFAATILGVRPAAVGFSRVVVRPQLGSLRRAEGTIAHPLGDIRVSLNCQADGRSSGVVTLPKGLSGDVIWGTTVHPLVEGQNPFSR